MLKDHLRFQNSRYQMTGKLCIDTRSPKSYNDTNNMKIFEFHFNPKGEAETVFDSFVYEPENIEESRLGNLYMAGQLTNVLSKNTRFLDELAIEIKKSYFKLSHKTPEQSLKESLKGTNDYLSEVSEKGDVRWLGHLHFAILSFKDFLLNFTKVGDIKILVMRGGEIMDVSQNLEFQDIEPYPLKIFTNIATGKLAAHDKVLVITKEIYEYFASHNLLSAINKLSVVEEKTLKAVLRPHQASLQKIAGICLLLFLEDVQTERKAAQTITFQQEGRKKKFPIPSFNLPFRVPSLLSNIGKILIALAKKPFSLLGALITNIFKGIAQRFAWLRTIAKRKNIILIIALIAILIIGSRLFPGDNKAIKERDKAVLEEIQLSVNQAENYLASQQEDEAENLLRESWTRLESLTQEGAPFRGEAVEIRQSIFVWLETLNKVEKKEPEVLLEVSSHKDFEPEKLVMFDGTPYLYDSSMAALYQGDDQGVLAPTDYKFSDGAVFLGSSLVFFGEPNLLLLFEDGVFNHRYELGSPYSGFKFDVINPYYNNLYFLDAVRGEIVKYRFKDVQTVLSAVLWLDQGAKKATGAKSMAIDGSIWLLREDNSIDRYAAGVLQSTLALDIFPFVKDVTKIKTYQGLPYLYLLEPAQKRVVIVDKEGSLIKQFQNEKFDDLKDMDISPDGENVYLLNGSTVYKLELGFSPAESQIE